MILLRSKQYIRNDIKCLLLNIFYDALFDTLVQEYSLSIVNATWLYWSIAESKTTYFILCTVEGWEWINIIVDVITWDAGIQVEPW